MEGIKLNTGAVMPALSVGFAIRDERNIVDAIASAIEIGYRGFDTAEMYYTEPFLAEALAKAFTAGSVQREDVFVTTKLDPFEDPVTSLKKSLSALQLDYVDLYLIHLPVHFKKDTLLKDVQASGDSPSEEELWRIKRNILFKQKTPDMVPFYKEQWQDMERCVELGLAKAIGVSNFSVKKIEDLLVHAKITPAVNQVEVHPLWQQSKLREYCKEKGIVVTAYSPLGATGNAYGTNDVITNPTIKDIAVKLDKTPAQVILQWILGKGLSCIIRSYDRGRQLENFGSQGWTLEESDCQRIDGLPDQKRYINLHWFVNPEHGPYKTQEEIWDEEI